MTREEAIKELKEDKMLYETDLCHAGDGSPDGRLLEALDMAIEALQAETIPLSVADKIGEERERLQEKVAELQEKNADRPHGEWLYRWNDVECSECGEFEKKKTNYCPNCGAVMGAVMKEDRE